MKSKIHRTIPTLLFLLCTHLSFTIPAVYDTWSAGSYTLVVEGFDWGPAVSKVILALTDESEETQWEDFTVFVRRHTDCLTIPPDQASGQRSVIYGYQSDDHGQVDTAGGHYTLVLAVAPNDPLGSPIQYARNVDCPGNNWIEYQLTVVNQVTNQVWNQETDRIVPLVDRFDLSGKFTHGDITMSYAIYAPETDGPTPLIIWLHGGGEGGTDPSIPLIANRAANYASDEIQSFFGGAYVLVPQSPTRWMDNGDGGSTRGDTDDIYHEALMALFQEFINAHPDVDRNRIYVGGCSNGGYITLKLLLEHPDFFAAAFPSALAYYGEYLTDHQIQSIKDIPMWFVHSKDDPVTVPDKTVELTYKKLKEAGASNLHFTYYDHVVDITGLLGGDGYHYNGHWSWIYSHANHCRYDLDGSLVTIDGRPVTIMEWLAAQRK